MTKTLTALMLPLLALTTFSLAQATEPALSHDDRQALIELLEDSRQELEELAALSTGEHWAQAPAEGRWSVGQVVEHLMLAEDGMYTMATGALEAEVDPEWETIAQTTPEQLIGMLKDRSQKFDAPEPFQPKNDLSRSELLGNFAKLRARTLDFVRTTDAPVRQHTAEGPAGKMNVHQWLTLIAGHNLRHNLQILEAQEQLMHPMPAETATAPGH